MRVPQIRARPPRTLPGPLALDPPWRLVLVIVVGLGLLGCTGRPPREAPVPPARHGGRPGLPPGGSPPVLDPGPGGGGGGVPDAPVGADGSAPSRDPHATLEVVEHDPLEGMDESGRIPKVELPVDVKNPERWRYFPEGRLLRGNIFERFLVSTFITPLFFFESDIGAGGGVAFTDIDFRNTRRQEFAGIFLTYTTEGQQNYSMIWRRWLDHRELPGGGVIQEERSFLRGSAGYTRTLTNRFFGLGPETRESAETSYTDELFRLSLGIQKSLPEAGDDFVLDLGVAYEHHNLLSGRISDRPSTDESFPVLFADGDDHHSGWVTGGLRYDTRDSQHNPYEGFAVGLTGRTAPLQTDLDVGAVVRLYGTGVLEVPGIFHHGGDENEEHPPTDVIAAAAFVEDTVGNLPFWALPSLGGSDTLRGFIANRWTGESAWHSAVEYRFWMVPRGVRFTDYIRVERLGAALFFEAGSVERRLEELFGAKVRYSYGFGLRASFERTALLRADFGFSNEGLNFTANFGLSF